METFSEILSKLCRSLQMDPKTLSAWDRELVVDAINAAVKSGWLWAAWPKAVHYLQQKVSEPLPAEVEAGDILGVFCGDPRTDDFFTLARAQISDWRASAQHYESVWIRWRGAPPKYTAEAWDATRAYAAGALVCFLPLEGYSADGECYRAKSATSAGEVPTGAQWEAVPFPDWLGPYVELAGAASLFRGKGNLNDAWKMEQAAAPALANAVVRLVPVERITR